jgi:hypothetical protein
MWRFPILTILACTMLNAQNPSLQQFMGTGIISGTYVSGAGTITGAGTCQITIPNTTSGGAIAQATVQIVSGALGAGTALDFRVATNASNSYGSGYATPPTSATLLSTGSTGSASCTAGSITVTTSTAETSNRAQIYASLLGKSFPKPIFGAQLVALTDVACGGTQITASTPCIFTPLGSPASPTVIEAQVDLLAQNPPNGLGVSVIQINFDPYYWIDNSTTGSQNARTLFTAVLQYIYNTYGAGSSHTPVVHVRLEPSYASGSLATICESLTGQASFVSPADVATCVTTVPASASWLQISSVQYSVYGYLAKYYGPNSAPPSSCTTLGSSCPVVQDFSDIHEPTTINGNYGWGPSPGTNTGTASAWQAAYNTMAGEVSTRNASVNNGIAFDRYEQPYATTMLASPGLGPVAYVGGDEYTTGINSNYTVCPSSPSITLCGDMYNLAAILSLAANNYGLRVLLTESWVPSWAQPFSGTASLTATDGNAYEGLGNCDWQTLDFIRQTLSATTMWASANRLSEVNFFSAANTSTACVYTGGPNLTTAGTIPNTDRFAPPSRYLTNVIAPATVSGPGGGAKKSKTFYWLQQLIDNWTTVVASGQPLPW